MKTGIRSFLATVVLGTASFGSVRLAPATTVDYRGGTYTQTFDSLPNPGAISVNTASALVIDGIT